MKRVDLHIAGVAPLIMHNARLSDPLDKWAKLVSEVAKKRGKTEEDLEELSRREWYGGLYTNEDGAPILPAANLERMIRDGAAKSKQGKTVQAGCIVPDDAPVLYTGPKKPDDMWASQNFFGRQSCKVGQQRVIRTRPYFREWECKFSVLVAEDVVNPDDLKKFVEVAGRLVGIGDWRPRHGRFEVKNFKVSKKAA